MAPVTRNLTLDTLLLRRDSNRKYADTEHQKLQVLLDAEDPSDLPRIRASVKRCERHLATLQELDNQIAEAIEEDEKQEHDMATDVECATEYEVRLSDIIIAAEVRIEDDIEKAQQATTTHDKSNTTVSSNGNLGKRFKNLPKLQIAPFDGDPLKWQEFWDGFDSAINSNTDLSAVDKFQYLKEFLKGNALLLTEGYRLTEANYETVLDMLKERFGDKEVAIQAHFDALMSMPPASGKLSDVQRVFDECEVHIRSLVALELHEATFGRVFAPILKSKLPEDIRLELERRHDGTPWTLDSMRRLLRTELHARRMSKQVIGQVTTVRPPSVDFDDEQWSDSESRSRSTEGTLSSASCFLASDGKRGNKPFVPCPFCNKSGHFPDECETYPDVHSRQLALKAGCFLCLRRSHREDQCKSPPKHCVHCKVHGTHHRSLCPARFGKATEETTFTISADEFVPQAFSLVATSEAARTRRGLAIMQTALATIKGTKGTEQVRLLFDPASTRSFGRVDVLRRIGAKRVGKETLAVAGLGSESRTKAEYEIAELTLLLNDGFEFPLTVNSVNSISCPIQKQALKPRIPAALSTLELADPAEDRPELVQVDILIGLDLYYSLIGFEQCRMGTLVILDSKVGYIASGCIPSNASLDEKTPQDTVMMLSAQAVSNYDENSSSDDESLRNTEYSGCHDTKDEQVTRFSRFDDETSPAETTNVPLETPPLDTIDDDSTSTVPPITQIPGSKPRHTMIPPTLLAHEPSAVYFSMFDESIRVLVTITILLLFRWITSFEVLLRHSGVCLVNVNAKPFEYFGPKGHLYLASSHYDCPGSLPALPTKAKVVKDAIKSGLSYPQRTSHFVCFGPPGPLYKCHVSPGYLDTPASQLHGKPTPAPGDLWINLVGCDRNYIGRFGDATRVSKELPRHEFSIILRDGSSRNLHMNAEERLAPSVTLQPFDVDAIQPHCKPSGLAEVIVDSPTEAEVDILLGLDYYYSFVGQLLVRTGIGLILKESSLGIITTGYTLRATPNMSALSNRQSFFTFT